jgi:phage terminase large subunit GpA-like protein
MIYPELSKLIAPTPPLDVATWADRYRKLSPESSAEVGNWVTDRAPYQRGMMQAFTERGVRKIVIMSSCQIGKSELILNALGYLMSMNPGPILLFQPSQELAESFSKDRLGPMIRDTPILKGLVKDARLRNSNNTLLHKTFPGGQVTLAGIQSSSSIASRPIKVLLIDEVDRAPLSAYVSGSGQKEGDPVALAEMRVNNFYNSLIILASTPTQKGLSRIEAAYEESDRRRYFVHCPHCHHPQTLKFPQLKWTEHDPKTTHYECESCKKVIDEKLKHKLLLQGKWTPEQSFKSIAGFHISELYSPWRKWEDITAKYLREKVTTERLQVWVNTCLGETFEERGQAPDWKALYDRREAYRTNAIPAGVILLSAGVDIQHDGIHIEIVGWSENKESYSIDYRVLTGNTTTEEPWKKLDQVLDSRWKLNKNMDIGISMTAIDSGYLTNSVYGYVKGKPSSKVIAIKGIPSNFFIIGVPSHVQVNIRGKRIQKGMRVFPVGVNLLKNELLSWLNLEKPLDGEPYPSGFCHFPKDYTDEYFKQLTAESLMTKIVKGYAKTTWHKMRENHALDCRVYARAAASLLGLDRWTPQDWEHHKQQLGLQCVQPAEVENVPVFSF